MRILILVDKGRLRNPFVETLVSAMQLVDKTLYIDCSVEIFWNDNVFSYDIVHFMWPECVLMKEYNVEALQSRIQMICKQGVHIVSTCHNLVPHYNKNINDIQAYKVVYLSSEIIFHMGAYSMKQLSDEYPHVQHVLLPHHIYDDRYQILPTKEEACRALGLPTNKRYVLCFGLFRDKEERSIVRRAATATRQNKDIVYLAPRFIYREHIYNVRTTLRILYYNLFHQNIIKGTGFVEEKDVVNYFAASDVVLIQRKRILNSGNLPLGLYLGKVIVGPNSGNVEEILKETGNFIFDKDDMTGTSVGMAIKNGMKAYDEGQGRNNAIYAREHLSSKCIASILVGHLKRLVGK